MLRKRIEEILMRAEKPARYIGGEFNAPIPKPGAPLRFLMCFPDVYEVAVSNLGIRILSGILEKRTDTSVERCYAPWADMRDLMEENGIPLFSIDSFTPAADFDMIGFSLQYELCYTTVLRMLRLAGIPALRADRDRADKHGGKTSENIRKEHLIAGRQSDSSDSSCEHKSANRRPLIIAGGPACVNPEPFRDFLDLIVIGDGEDVIDKLAGLYVGFKDDRAAFMRAANGLEGVYVPELNPGGVEKKVEKAVVHDLDGAFFPVCPTVPSLEAVHDRAVLEVFRGCTRGCRFCQAGFIYRPIREKTPETLMRQADELLKNTGYDELSLSSLSTGDYPKLLELAAGLTALGKERRVTVTLPSLRMDSFDPDFLVSERLTSVTFAPEAGTQRLRNVINKNITDDNIEDSLRKAFMRGFSSVKLYFMLGLPTETDEDVQGIVELCRRAKQLYRQHSEKKKPLRLSVSTSVFIPKPFTPFQWESMAGAGAVTEKQAYLKAALQKTGANYSYHDIRQSRIEAAFARGDSRLSSVLLYAEKSGCYLDGWSEFFDCEKWEAAFSECGLNMDEYLAERQTKTVLPWEFVDVGVTKKYLLAERGKALKAETTPDCRGKCLGCGAKCHGRS